MENTLLERLLQAVDEVVLYRTDGKIQALKKVREEIRQKNENADEAVYRKLWPDMVPGAYNDY
jgi:hypothetical protein